MNDERRRYAREHAAHFAVYSDERGFMSGLLSDLLAALADAERERGHYRDAGIRTFHEVEQVLGKALGYPSYGPEMFPDGKPNGSVCVGEHVPESLADEAAARIKKLEQQIVVLEAELSALGPINLIDE